MRKVLRLVGVVLVAALVVAGGIVVLVRLHRHTPGAAIAALGQQLIVSTPAPRTLDAYRGLGTWVDAFDYAPAYQSGGRSPAVGPSAVEDMAAHGVKTVFLQVARDDRRSPGGIVDRALLAEFLIRAHRAGLRVVGWYLPKFGDLEADFANIAAMAGFSVLGHRLDGIAVDIEYTDDVPDPVDRNLRLVQLATRVRAQMGGDTLGAIVLPPVQTEVVNPTLWPAFPWRPLAPLFDAWLPMSYWTFRTVASGYHDGYTYNEESTRRLRADLGDPNAPVHGIGGIGDLVTIPELDAFVRSLADTSSIGGSIYDWATLTPAGRDELAAQLGS